jgi:methionyl-tRNA formyltransferase
MRILFWGTPEFALPSLRALSEEGHDVVAVVTQPDRPAGRGRHLRPSPVKSLALEEGIPVLTPERPRGEAFLEELRGYAPEISVVVAYGHILRPEVLDLPPRGSVNVHASLLPELRGAAPVNWAVIRGLPLTGVTIMRMTPGMDEGPILLQADTRIDPGESASELYQRLAELGAGALVEVLAMMSAGISDEREQDHAAATYAPKLTREGARIDWTFEAPRVSDFIRGMDAVPGAWSALSGEALKLFRPEPFPGDGEPEERGGADADWRGTPPGTVVAADPRDGIVVACGLGAIRIREVQPPGKRRMDAGAWVRGQRELVGRRFE